MFKTLQKKKKHKKKPPTMHSCTQLKSTQLFMQPKKNINNKSECLLPSQSWQSGRNCRAKSRARWQSALVPLTWPPGLMEAAEPGGVTVSQGCWRRAGGGGAEEPGEKKWDHNEALCLEAQWLRINPSTCLHGSSRTWTQKESITFRNTDNTTIKLDLSFSWELETD